ncbi:MAG: SH3 domain-containing protein [Candidatus Binatia bacterium]
MLRRALLSFTLLWLAFSPGNGTAELMGKKGKIQGESFVNLRSGPGLNYPPRAVLRRGEEVTVEGEEGSWYLVSLTDGKRGYVYKGYVHLFGEGATKEVGEGKTKAVGEEATNGVPREDIVTEPSEILEKDLPISPPLEVERETPKGRPLPVIKVLEGKEWEILRWFGAALCIFIIGWICGGNYYLRRDRINGSKLHF